MNPLANLGIDLPSLIIYVVNFGIIYFFIAKFLSGPIISMLEKRATKIKNNLDDIKVLKEEMEKNKLKMEEEQKKAEAEMDKKIISLNEELDKKLNASKKAIEKERNEMLENASKQIEKQKKEMTEELKADINDKIVKIVSHIISNKIPKEILETSVEEAWDKYNGK